MKIKLFSETKREISLCFFSFILVALTGCEQILNELDTLEFTVSKTIVMNETASSTLDGIQIIQILNDGLLTKSSYSLQFNSGIVMIPVELPDYNLLVALLSDGGCEISGIIENLDDKDVVFNFYFSMSGDLTDPLNQATLIGSIGLKLFEMKSIQGYNSEMLSFFSDPQNENISIVYVYLTGTPNPVHIRVHSIAMVLSPVYHITKVIDPSEEYGQYIDRVEAIDDVHLSGSATNQGGSDVMLLLAVSAQDTMVNWAGEVIQITLQPGETIQFEDWASYLVNGGEDRLKACLRYLVDDYRPIQGDLYMESDQTINVHINSLVLSGTVSVIL